MGVFRPCELLMLGIPVIIVVALETIAGFDNVAPQVGRARAAVLLQKESTCVAEHCACVVSPPHGSGVGAAVGTGRL